MKINKILNSIKQTSYYSQNVSDFMNINNYPIITKQMVLDNRDKFIVDNVEQNKLLQIFTSGSTGTPLNVLWLPLDYCKSLSELWKIRKKFEIYPKDRYVTYHAVVYNGVEVIFNKAIIKNNCLSLSKISLDESTYLYYYNLLISFKPKFMLLPPSFLFGFLSYLDNQKLRLPNSIRLIELTGEICSEEMFTWFENLYPEINWIVMYGMQEFNGIAYGTNKGLNVINDNVFVEIVDEFDKPVQIGHEGNIIVTGLKNSVFPLIRYKTEDKGFFDDVGLLHITKSRSNDSFKFNDVEFDGTIFWSLVLYLQEYLNITILQFQVRYVDDCFKFFFIFSKDSIKKIEFMNLDDCIYDFLCTKYNLTIKVSVNIVDDIIVERTSNKIKYFINEN